MDHLKICVERAVRPVRASEIRKDRMRRELLAHLWDSFEEELGRDAQEGTAVERALQRFGHPADLARALQDSVPLGERLLFTPVPVLRRIEVWLDRIVGRRRGESPVRHAARLASVEVLLTGAALLWAALVALRPGGPQTDPSRGLSWWSAALTLPGLGVFAFALLTYGMRAALGLGDRSARSWRWMAIHGAASSLVVIVLGFVFLALLGSPSAFGIDPSARVPEEMMTIARGTWVLAAFTPLLLAVFAYVSARDLRRRQEWGGLEIDA
jgi:hypothetical protein